MEELDEVTETRPLARLPIGATARCDCRNSGPLVRIIHYEGEYVNVRSLGKQVNFSTPAARLWAV